MKDVKTWDQMTNKELKHTQPLGLENHKQWQIEMEKRGLFKKKTIMSDLFIRTKEASQMLGISKSTLIRFLEKGIIKGKKIKFDSERKFEWRISENEISKFRIENEKRGLF